METQIESQINPIELIDDVSKNLVKLKELVGMIPKKEKKEKKEKKQSDKPKEEKLPKWVFVKEGYVYRKKVEGSEKMKLKKFVLEHLLK